MRVFQIVTVYPDYYGHFAQKNPASVTASYQERLRLLLEDRVGGVHLLEPSFNAASNVAITFANDAILQQRWAKEEKLATLDATEILLAQIEKHRAEVIYNMDPVSWDSAFVRRLPGCVKKTICWRASTMISDLTAYDLRVCNFPNMLRSWEMQGMKSGYFSPSYDPAMTRYAQRRERPIDIAFVGNYSALHHSRNRLLELVSELADQYSIVFALLHPRFKPLINLPLIRRIPGPFPFLPAKLRRLSVAPVYGLGLYELLSRSKIALNAGADLSGEYRGNMRCFEAMGCGACMLSDKGIYPPGLETGTHFEVFSSPENAVDKVHSLLGNEQAWTKYSVAGTQNLQSKFSKAQQWTEFQKLVEELV